METLHAEDDVALMRRVQQDDEEAFRLLWQRYREAVRRFFYHLTWDEGQADDFTQETFLRLWLARQRWQPTGKFTTYLFQIAKNYWLNQRKKQARRPEVVSLEEIGGEEGLEPDLHLVDYATQPELVLWENYRRWQIRQAVKELPEPYRLVVVLNHFEGLRYREIAEVLDIPVGTVKSRMNAAVKRLREKLKDEI
jgi:RNA polymerase sigma-70 factor (ECF subfamily)